MLVTPHDVTNSSPRLSPRAEQYDGMRLVFRICPGSSSGSAFPIESGSDYAIGIKQERAANATRDAVVPPGQGHIHQLGASNGHKSSPDGAYGLLYVSTVVSSRPICEPVFQNHHFRRPAKHSQYGQAGNGRWPCDACPCGLAAVSLRPMHVLAAFAGWTGWPRAMGPRCMSSRPV
jgi:hypothetical protein